jgi:hypothetical protein
MKGASHRISRRCAAPWRDTEAPTCYPTRFDGLIRMVAARRYVLDVVCVY